MVVDDVDNRGVKMAIPANGRISPALTSEPRRGGSTVLERAREEHELIDRIARGDEAAFQAIYAAYFASVWRHTWYQLAGDPARVEDVVQEVFVAIWRSAARFRGDASVKTWIFHIAHNIISTARSHAHREPLSLVAPASEEGDEPAYVYDPPDDSFEDNAAERILLAEAIGHLPAKHQAVIYLVFVQGFSLDETANILNLPRNTVKSRLLNARRALRDHLHLSSSLKGERSDA